MDLKCQLVTRLNKEGKPYEVVVIKLTESLEKLVFLEPAEREVIKITQSTEQVEKPVMPFNA